MTYNLCHKKTLFILLASLFLTLYTPYKLLFFAPYLVTLFYQRPQNSCLLSALLLGLLIDLLSSYSRFGITALNYFLCTLPLYPAKRHFFSDKLSTLPLMTFLFSLLSLLIHFITHPFMPTLSWIASDLFIMPLFDALAAFLLYIAPPLLIGKRVKRGREYFLS